MEYNFIKKKLEKGQYTKDDFMREISTRDINGRTVLHYSNYEMLSTLFNYKFHKLNAILNFNLTYDVLTYKIPNDIINIRDVNGYTPLGYHFKNGCDDNIIKLFIDNGGIF